MNSGNVKWQVSLANGETFYENKGQFEEIEGELSPWNKLLAYIEENKTAITSLALYTDKGNTWNIPSSGKNPHFHVFSLLGKPLGYRFYRKLGTTINNEAEVRDLYSVAVAIYDTYELQIWVSEDDERNSWSLVVPIK